VAVSGLSRCTVPQLSAVHRGKSAQGGKRLPGEEPLLSIKGSKENAGAD